MVSHLTGQRRAGGGRPALRPLAAIALLAASALAIGAGAGPRPVTAYVAVSVATVWTSPASPRAIDRPALGDPVDMRGWSRVLTTALRIGLGGRTQTQALLGEPVVVLARSGAWERVVVPDQPTPRDRRG